MKKDCSGIVVTPMYFLKLGQDVLNAVLLIGVFSVLSNCQLSFGTFVIRIYYVLFVIMMIMMTMMMMMETQMGALKINTWLCANTITARVLFIMFSNKSSPNNLQHLPITKGKPQLYY